jgi:hypothetical protein
MVHVMRQFRRRNVSRFMPIPAIGARRIPGLRITPRPCLHS